MAITATKKAIRTHIERIHALLRSDRKELARKDEYTSELVRQDSSPDLVRAGWYPRLVIVMHLARARAAFRLRSRFNGPLHPRFGRRILNRDARPSYDQGALHPSDLVYSHSVFHKS